MVDRSFMELIVVFYKWIVLIHTGLEGPRYGQIIMEIRTADGWRRSDVHSMPPGMLSAGRLLRPLIGCRPQMGGSADQTSYIRQTRELVSQSPSRQCPGHLFVLAGSTFETPRELFSPLRSGHLVTLTGSMGLYSKCGCK